MTYPYTIKIGGEAGFGIMSAGSAVAKIATRSGYQLFSYAEYPSIIRGGHNVVQITLAPEPVYAQYQPTQVLVAFNQETIDLHKHELIEGSVVIYDEDKGMRLPTVSVDVKGVHVPFNALATTFGGSTLMRNTVALGTLMALVDGDLSLLFALIEEEFGKKSPRIVKANQQCAQAGYDHIKTNYPHSVQHALTPRPVDVPPMVLTANEAIALGAIAAGMQFSAIYPMTPTSNILHTLAPFQDKYNYIYKQPEDEISAINMALGAAHAGARAMVATAGGGFNLMAEGYGLAGITELPIVIIVGMRGGPATGLPTWTEQADLRFVLHASQGDFPRIVLAAGDAQEAFDQTMLAFNLADTYQTPVVVLVDKHICECLISLPPFDVSAYVIDRGKLTFDQVDGFARFAPGEDGVSLRSVPGSGNHFIANSDEHNEHGYSSESATNRVDQMNKRMSKLALCAANDMPQPQLFGPSTAPITIVSWGSNKGAILEAMRQLPQVNFMHLAWMNPFPAQAVQAMLEKANYLICIENSYSAQLRGLIREQTGILILDTLQKYDGRPFYPEEIIAKINSIGI
jgi:2-oxoglutarate ferredoxin oxidoreductase subunit alpha